MVVPYEHDPADASAIFLAVTHDSTAPEEHEWMPALRDTIEGRLVVWVRGTIPAGGVVWLRDRHGQRRVKPTNM